MGCFSRLIIILLSASMILPTINAPSDNAFDAASCPGVVRVALETTDDACAGLAQNEACYGHVLVQAQLRSSSGVIAFNQAGDTTDLLDIESLQLSSMDTTTGMWGVALMNLQTYMQYAEPEDVTFLLFGDVTVENQVQPVARIAVTVSATTYVNVRLGPSARAGAIGTLAPGQTVVAQGRLADSSWLRVEMPDSGRVGWLSADLARSEQPLDSLDVMEGWTPYYGPMQAFALRSGADDSLCPEAPESGILIQTPEGVAEVTLLVNGVDVQLSNATAFLQAQPNGTLSVDVLDGWVDVTAGGVTQTGFAGTQISVPLDASGSPAGPPVFPVPYDPGNVNALPVASLDNPVVIVPPLTTGDIVALVDSWNDPSTNPAGDTSDPVAADDLGTTGDGTTDPGTTDPGTTDPGTTDPGTTDPGTADPGTSDPDSPPGLDGVVPPGQGSTPPGQGGVPPGQDKK